MSDTVTAPSPSRSESQVVKQPNLRKEREQVVHAEEVVAVQVAWTCFCRWRSRTHVARSVANGVKHDVCAAHHMEAVDAVRACWGNALVHAPSVAVDELVADGRPSIEGGRVRPNIAAADGCHGAAGGVPGLPGAGDVHPGRVHVQSLHVHPNRQRDGGDVRGFRTLRTTRSTRAP